LPEIKKKPREEKKRAQAKQRQRKRDSESASSSSGSEQEKAGRKQPRPALEYRAAHMRDTPHAHTKTDLLIVRLPVSEVKCEKIKLLYDSTISLMKLKYLKDDPLIYENKIALTGITGHKIHTLGKVYATINMYEHIIKHAFYVIGDTLNEHDGILGINFLRKHCVKCDFQKTELKIRNVMNFIRSAK